MVLEQLLQSWSLGTEFLESFEFRLGYGRLKLLDRIPVVVGDRFGSAM